jgi:N-acetylmuramoyl-L-alanine amidase
MEDAVNATDRDLDTLARTIWAEARGEAHEGRVAVAWVIRHRAERSGWPAAVADVCRQPWQFSCWNRNDPNLAKLEALSIDDPLYRECHEVGRAVLAGEVDDPTGGADHYFADYIRPPDWAERMTFTTKIGRHLFYRA